MKWLNEHTADARSLLNLLTDVVIEYMSAQARPADIRALCAGVAAPRRGGGACSPRPPLCLIGRAQVTEGAHMLQLFEAMGEHITEPAFNQFALPCIERISAALKARGRAAARLRESPSSLRTPPAARPVLSRHTSARPER